MQILEAGVNEAESTLDWIVVVSFLQKLELGVVDLGLGSVFGRLSGKLGEFIKRILYLCFASFVRTTYTMVA